MRMTFCKGYVLIIASITLMLLAPMLTTSCRKDTKPTPMPIDLKPVVATLESLEAEAKKLTDAKTNWLNNGCDGMLWEGKYNAVVNLSNIRASEFIDYPGRFGRTPAKRCFNGNDNGAKTTWSRDMATGFILWAWRTKNLDALKDHAEYGVSNQWQMGAPLSDGRTIYTPQLIGLLYQAIYALGGPNNANRKWPSLYTKGLDDYEAHLQMLDIVLRQEIEEKLGERTLEVMRKAMRERVSEHAAREPNNVFYQAVEASYTGDFAHAASLCVDRKVGSYVRCDKKETCTLSELIFSCDYILRQFRKELYGIN